MDYKATGKFIAKLRCERNWTQKELAQRLGVTDKAVSRWETGRGFPDVSLLPVLSETFSVSINELLLGDCTTAEDAQSTADTMLVRLLHDSKKKLRMLSLIVLFSLGGVLLLFSSLMGYDSSWVSIFSIFGLLVILSAVFVLLKNNLPRAIISVLLLITLAFSFFELRDYVYVTRYSLPPLYTFTIETGWDLIRYQKLFYTVERHRSDTGKDHYEIVR